MKPPLPRTLSVVPRLPHVQLEIAKAIHNLTVPDHVGSLRHRRIEIAALSAELEAIKHDLLMVGEECLALLRTELHDHVGERPFSEEIDKAGYRQDQPRWLKGSGRISGRWSGGAGQAPPSQPKTPQEERLTPRYWTIGHNQGPSLDEPPEIPVDSPPTNHAIWDIAKASARWLAKAGVRPALEATAEATLGGPVGDFLLALEATYWLAGFLPSIYSYLDSPKTLEELQKNPKKGYDEHHNVEQWSENDGIPRNLIDASENRPRIPRIKHWELNGWQDKKNENLLDPQLNQMTPREYLRGKSWEERYRFGLDALKKFGVLKP